MRPLRIIAPGLLAAAALGGCGNDRADEATAALTPSRQTETATFPKAGLTVQVPRNLPVGPTPAPGVFRGNFGESFLSAFAYRRREQLPRNRRELGAARRRLVRAVKTRDGGFELRASRLTRVDGSRAIELVGDQTFSKRRLRLRSLHVYKGSAEYVIELAAPVGDFRRLDRAIFPTVRRSLDVTGTVRSRS